MPRIAPQPFMEPEEARRRRGRESDAVSPALEGPLGSAGILLHLQRTIGNQAVNALLGRGGRSVRHGVIVQRDDDQSTAGGQAPPPASAPGNQGTGDLASVAGEQPLDLPPPEPVTLPIEGGYGPGDYEVPNQVTVMAMREGSPFVQRDDTPPQGSGGSGGDGGGQPDNQVSGQSTVTLGGPKQAPYQMQVTRTLHMIPPLSLDKLHIDFFQDPQISIGVDSQGTLSAQVAQNIFMLHLLRNWKTPVDLGLAAVWQQNILPKLQSQQGGQLQAEQHITKTFSVTWTIQGMRTDSDDGKSRVWSVTGGAGIIKYF